MEIIEVEAGEYSKIFEKTHHVFNKAAFNYLNADKCEKVFYLVFKDSKIRLGIIFGLRNNILHSPFSAPFGGFETVNDDVKLTQIDASLLALETWAKNNNFKAIKIVSPPFFYYPNFIAKLNNAYFRAGFQQKNIELNYQFLTSKLDDNYENLIWYNAKKNLKRSLKETLFFEKTSKEDAHIAYEVIAQNRKERGFPLKMSWEQVQHTMTVIEVDFFLVKNETNPIAAAVVFHVAPNTVQVVYWGDLPAFAEYKTMNYLSFNVFKHYKENNIQVVDIGPSTENSIPNNGLCEFKESIGCDISIKTEFYKEIN